MACRVCGAGGYRGLCGDCCGKRSAAAFRAKYGKAGRRAHSIVRAAIERGDLPPASERLCVDCHKAAKVYDHRDYRRPLDVDPVCRSCNRKRGVSAILLTKDGRPIDAPSRLMAEAVWSLAERRAA